MSGPARDSTADAVPFDRRAAEQQKAVDAILARFTVPPDRVYLDEFTVKRVGGNGRFAPHAGQSVWILPYGGTLGATFDQLAFGRAMQSGDTGQMDAAIDSMCGVIAERVAAWDLRDVFEGTPYPQPFRNRDAVKQLAASLVWHLYSLVLGIEPEGNADGGEANSPPTFSTTPDRAKTTKPARRVPPPRPR